jgi:hypothetical protein
LYVVLFCFCFVCGQGLALCSLGLSIASAGGGFVPFARWRCTKQISKSRKTTKLLNDRFANRLAMP